MWTMWLGQSNLCDHRPPSDQSRGALKRRHHACSHLPWHHTARYSSYLSFPNSLLIVLPMNHFITFPSIDAELNELLLPKSPILHPGIQNSRSPLPALGELMEPKTRRHLQELLTRLLDTWDLLFKPVNLSSFIFSKYYLTFSLVTAGKLSVPSTSYG